MIEKIKNIREANNQMLVRGIPTCIPFPFKRLQSSIPGITKKDIILITANTGEQKSKFTRFLCNYMIEFLNKFGLNGRVIYNSLEEPAEKTISSLLIKEIKRRFGKVVSYYDIMNYRTMPLSKDKEEMINDVLANPPKILDCFDIVSIPNSIRFYRYILKKMFNRGKFVDRGKTLSLEEVFDNFDWKYVPDNERDYLIVVTDTVDALGTDKAHNFEEVLFFTKFLSRNMLSLRGGVMNIWVQQQNPDLERKNDSVNDIKPGFDKLLTCRATSQLTTLALGLFSPQKVGIKRYMGVDISEYPNLRSLILLKTREGSGRKNEEILLNTNPVEETFVPL